MLIPNEPLYTRPVRSSRSGRLLPLSPLRTVRESFPSYGSSTLKTTFVVRSSIYGCHFFTYVYMVGKLAFISSIEVVFPLLFVRIRKALNLRMPNYFGGIEKRQFTCLLCISCRKYPMLVTSFFKVFGFNPMVAFVGMSAFGPSPQKFKNFVVQP